MAKQASKAFYGYPWAGVSGKWYIIPCETSNLWKMLLFCSKTVVKESRKFELARLKKKKKKKKENVLAVWKLSGLVLSRCF